MPDFFKQSFFAVNFLSSVFMSSDIMKRNHSDEFPSVLIPYEIHMLCVSCPFCILYFGLSFLQAFFGVSLDNCTRVKHYSNHTNVIHSQHSLKADLDLYLLACLPLNFHLFLFWNHTDCNNTTAVTVVILPILHLVHCILLYSPAKYTSCYTYSQTSFIQTA